MPLDPIKVAVAMDSGLSAVCATCSKYWAAREQGVPGDACLAAGRCGSPLSGNTFPEYDGPLHGGLQSFCFVCGGKAQFGVRVQGKSQACGMCKDHLPLLDQLAPQGEASQPRPEVKDAYGNVVGPTKAKKRQSLFGFMLEVESYYANKEGRPSDPVSLGLIPPEDSPSHDSD